MRTDSFGVVHPEVADEPNLIGILHIAECGECQKRFTAAIGPEFLDHVANVVGAVEQERLQRAKHRSRQHA